MYCILTVLSSVDGYLGCLHILAQLMIHGQCYYKQLWTSFCTDVFLFLWANYLEVELVGRMVTLFI